MWHHAGHRARIAYRPFSKVGGLLVLLASVNHILCLIEGASIYDPPPPLTANIPPTDWETVLESVKNLVPGKGLKVSDYQYGRSLLPVPGAKAGQVQYALYPTTRIAAHTFECSTDGSQDGKPVITYRRPHERIYLGHVVIEKQNDREISPGLAQGTHPASNSSLPPKPPQTPIETTTSALRADSIPFLPGKLRGQAKTLPMTDASKEVAASARMKASKEVAGTAVKFQDEATRHQASIIAKELSDSALSDGMTIAIAGKPHPQDFKVEGSREGRQKEAKKDFIGSPMQPHKNQPSGRDVPNQDFLQKKVNTRQSSVRIFNKSRFYGSYKTKTKNISASTLGEGSNAVREPGKQDVMSGQVRDYHSSAASRRQKIHSDDVENRIERTPDLNEKISTSETSEYDNFLSRQKDNLAPNNQERPEDAKISGKLDPPEASRRNWDTSLASENIALNHNPKPADDVAQPEAKFGNNLTPGEKKGFVPLEKSKEVENDSIKDIICTHGSLQGHRNERLSKTKSAIPENSAVKIHGIPTQEDGVSPVSSTTHPTYKNIFLEKGNNYFEEKDRQEGTLIQTQNNYSQEVSMHQLDTKIDQNNNGALNNIKQPADQVTNNSCQDDLDIEKQPISNPLFGTTQESYLSDLNKPSGQAETGTDQPNKCSTEDHIKSDFRSVKKSLNLNNMAIVEGIPHADHLGNTQDHPAGRIQQFPKGMKIEDKLGKNPEPQEYKTVDIGAAIHDSPNNLATNEQILDHKIPAPEPRLDLAVLTPKKQANQDSSTDEKKEGHLQESDLSNLENTPQKNVENMIHSSQEIQKNKVKHVKAQKKKQKSKKNPGLKDSEIKENYKQPPKPEQELIDDFETYVLNRQRLPKKLVMKQERIKFHDDYQLAFNLSSELGKFDFVDTSPIYKMFESAFHPGGSKLKDNEIFPGIERIPLIIPKGRGNFLKGNIAQYGYKDTKSQSSKNNLESEHEIIDDKKLGFFLDGFRGFVENNNIDSSFMEVLAKHLKILDRSPHVPLSDMNLSTYKQISNSYHENGTDFIRLINLNVLVIGLYEGLRRVNTMIKQTAEITIVENWKLIRRSLIESKKLTKEEAAGIQGYYRLSKPFPNRIYPVPYPKPIFKHVELDILNSLGVFKSKRHTAIPTEFLEKKNSNIWSSREDLYWCSKYHGVDMELLLKIARESNIDSQLDILNKSTESNGYLKESTKDALLPWPLSPERQWLHKIYGDAKN